MNSILWNNSPDQPALVPVFDSLPCQLSLYYNDIQFGLDSIFMEDTVSNITYGAGNITSAPDFIDAGFANFHLKASSPAIGAAIDSLLHGDHWYYCPRIDMEGFPRPAPVGSFPDMGAFEHNSAWPVGGIGQARAIYNKLSFRNYPNPFQHQTTLEFQLPESSDVSIQVYNLQGQQTEVLESVHLTHGLHKIKWIPQQSGSHIYLIRISAHTASKKIFTFSGRLIQLK
jgi:hypothetical protein